MTKPSPVSARRDLGAKLRLYAGFAIAEYWIVDPTFEFLENAGDEFRLRLPEGATYRSATIAGLELDLESFWAAIAE